MLLQQDEDRKVRRLWHLRDTAEARAKKSKDPNDDGWHHAEREEAEGLVRWLKRRELEIQSAARRSKLRGGGWGRRVKGAAPRSTRFQIIHLTRIRDYHGHPRTWDHKGTLRERALKVAQSQVGVMEHGGNNMGAQVYRYIRENGGGGPEPWCGDFVAFCYRHAGSKAVSRNWAMAWFLEGRRVSKPLPGDITDYTFQHTGIFEKWYAGRPQAIEGNTGASGAVSDSATGGDGVYRKRRSTGLVKRYVRVLR